MILVDFSSTMHRSLYMQVKDTQPRKKDGKYITKEFQDYWKILVLEELFGLYLEFGNYLGNQGIVLCLDCYDKKYWRKDFYPLYKAQRSDIRDESDIDYKEFFEVQNDLINMLKENSPWKIFEVPGAEADDLILVLAKEIAQGSTTEPILIHSPDKDFIQSQRHSSTIKQYSPLTKKWITPDTKDGTMMEWIHEHICLGDLSDNVPKIVDGTVFSPEFINHLSLKNIDIDEKEFFFMSEEVQGQLVHDFEGNVYKKLRYGPVALKKDIEKHGSLDNLVKSCEILAGNFKRNYILVMEEGIPSDLRHDIMNKFLNASQEFNPDIFERYLNDNNLGAVVPMLPKEFRGELTAEFFEW